MNPQSKPLILLTNDDGIHASGLQKLVQLLRPWGDLTVVAPDKGQSGMSHAITMHLPIHIRKVKHQEDFPFYACTGTAVDCVKLALNQIMDRKPDFIFSGINHGSNSSIHIIYSGTMGAALEGAIHGVPSVGLSILDFNESPDFSSVDLYGPGILKEIFSNRLGKASCLNINFPGKPGHLIQGIKVCRQARGRWFEEFEKRTNPRSVDYYWLTGKYQNFEPESSETDEWALTNNYISIVPVNFDFTDYDNIDNLKHLEL
jgi:5'-nucleotidase